MVGVAQLVRAPDCGSGGCGFKSRLSPHSSRGVAEGVVPGEVEEGKGPGHRGVSHAPVAQLDRATDSESVGQRFEPSQAHHFIRAKYQQNFILLDNKNGTCPIHIGIG